MSATTVKLTVPEIVGFLKTVGPSCMFLSMETATTFKLNKYETGKGKSGGGKANPFGKVTKVASRLGWLNLDYKRAVESRIAKQLGVPAKEVEYTLGEVWHTHICDENGKPSPVLVNKETPEDGKFYIYYTHRKTASAKYIAENGETVTYEQLKPFLPPPRDDNPNKPIVRSIMLNNIRVLKARGLIARGA